MLKCSRFVFSYETPPDEVEDFILRSDDLAAQTYGRDKFFSRLNQVLDQARFLGWPLPRFGPNLPDDLTEIPPPGIDHIFENQAKLLVDVAPVTRVMLEDGNYCPVRMVCGSTAAGDLVWKCHLMLDREGAPYVQRNNQRFKVKTKGTRIVCQTESLSYDEKYLFGCFGGEESGIWPVPFLPEFFLDQPLAQKFSPEPGVVEVVKLLEPQPVHVFAKEMVPWYRPLEVDRSRALTFEGNSDYASAGLPPHEDLGGDQDEGPLSPNPPKGFDPGALVAGWDNFDEDETFDLDVPLDLDDSYEDEDDEGEEETTPWINLAASLTPAEEQNLAEYDATIANSHIASKAEAEDLRKDPEHKERAEKWLVTAVNRLRLLANHSAKIGALISLIERHQGHQILIIQPRQKWAAKVVDVLKDRGVDVCLHNPQNKTQTSRFYEGSLKVLVTTQPKEELFIEDLIIISVSTFNLISWVDWLNPSQVVYTIPTKQLGYSDYNFIPEHPLLAIETDTYKGPGLDILELAQPKPQSKPTAEATSKPKPKAKPKKPAKPKFKVKTGKGRPKSATSYEKALELVKKLEEKGQKCEIYAPDGKEALYITGMPAQIQGELD
jgi:hypothetical protein